MQINKKTNIFPNQPQPQPSEYELQQKLRNFSPSETNMYYMRRSPLRGTRAQASNDTTGEMVYIEPNEPNFKRAEESPLNNNYIIRSPGEVDDHQNNIYTRTEYALENPQNQISNINQYNTEQEKKRSRSPKTLNINENQEVEYNLRTLKWGRSPKFSFVNSPPENLMMERSYNNASGNIFLDQPMQQTSFVKQSDLNSREIVFAMNPRDLQEPSPGVLQRMSPQGNVEGESDTNSEKNDNVNQIKDLKTQLDKRNVVIKNDDNGLIDQKMLPNELEKIEDFVRPNMQEVITGEEVKKLVKQYVKAYDPRRGEDGNLISNSQMVVTSSTNDVFNDRYKVLQKMNKLSTILLSKRNTNTNNVENSPLLNRSFGEKTFDKNTLNNTVIGKKYLTNKKNRFLYVSLAMLSSKGLNTEDRIILRRMRIDKGGVVDLAQEQINKKDKFKIKKVKAAGRGHAMINPKYREKAAKIVQAWWRERKQKYNKILDQIIKIQSVWRGKFIRKFVYDIIYVSYLNQKFLDIMTRTLVNHVRPIVWDELFSRKKLIKNVLGNLLETKDKRFTALRIRPYFLRWDAIANFLKRRIEKSGRLVIKKGDKEQINKILRQYLYQWALRTNLEKYIGKAQDAENKKQKFFGAINLINGLTNFTKRNVYRNTHEPITNYLKDLLKNKLLKKITDKAELKNRIIKLRYYFNKWKNNVDKEKFRDFKGGVFNNNLNHVDNRMDKIKLKYYFDKWRKQIPRAKKIMQINEGSEILNRFILRTTHIDPLNAFAEKIDNEYLKETLIKLLILKRRILKNDLKDSLNRWKLNVIKLINKERRNEILATLIKNITNHNQKFLLYKIFNQWRQRPKINMNDEMSRYRDFVDILTNFYKKKLQPEKKDFMDIFAKTRSDRAKKISAQKILKNYQKQLKNLLRYYFYTWKNQIIKGEIEDLHQQLLRFLIYNRENINNRNKLSKYFTRWRLFTSDNKNYDNMEKLKNVLKGLDIISNIHYRRERDFLIRLYRLMGKDFRPIILSKIIKKIDKPRNTLRECLYKWKRVLDNEKYNENLRNLKGIVVNLGVKKVTNRSNRDLLMKAFFKWKNLCRTPDEYYPAVAKFLELLKKKIRKDACDEPFSRIKFTRNMTRPLLKIYNNYRNQENRLLNNKLRSIFYRWRKIVDDLNIKDLKTNTIFKLKKYLLNNLRSKLLSKYFTRWKLYRRKDLGISFPKGVDILSKLFKNNNYDLVKEIFKIKTNEISKKNALNKLINTLNNKKNKILHDTLYKLYRNAMNTDPNRMSKIETRLRLLVKRNEQEPRAKAFFKWRRIVNLLKEKENDINTAKKIIAMALRTNDRRNLVYALGTWRINAIKMAFLLREQYLKGLLVKQIKSSQEVKEDVNNLGKLRAAFLRWRCNLIPIDYLDRLKKIRKGCKVFKLALRKMQEKDIMDNIKNLANINRKNYLLNKFIMSLKPKTDKYILKKYFDKWRNKIGDTDKLINKLCSLFNNYINSDKIHDGLFKQPKNDLIDLFKNYHDVKNDKAKKIKDFIQGILKAKKNKDRIKATVLLNDIINKKHKILNETLKMYFIRYYRQTCKIQNDANARIIQKFIKEKLRKYFDKRQLIKNGVDLFEKYIKRRCLQNINHLARDNLLKNVLINGIKRQENANKKVLRNALNTWKNKIPLLRNDDAANKIINLFRTIKSKKTLNNLKKRLTLLKKINDNYDNKNQNNLYSHFQLWRYRTQKLKNIENAAIIQRFCRSKIKILNQKQSKNALKNLFKRKFIRSLTDLMNRASRVIGGKGEVVYKTLEDVLYRKPFDKFMNNLVFVGRVNALKKIQPKIHDKIKNYFLTLYLKKWKHNTYDLSVEKAKIMQKFLREQYAKRVKRNKEKRELILKAILQRKILNDMYKLQLPFNVWHKKARLMNFNDNVSKIQNAFRNYLARKKKDDLSTQTNWKNLIRNVVLKNIVSSMKNAGESKKMKKNRKKILVNIVKQNLLLNDQSSLKKYFDKWRRYVKYVNDCALKIQNAYRNFRANKEKNKLKNIKDLLLKILLKKQKAENDKKRSVLRKWNNIVNFLNCEKNAAIIQKFIRPKLAKLLNDRFKKFFKDNALKKTHKYLLLVGKLNKLQNAINRPSIHRFFNNLKIESKNNKINQNLKNAVNNKDNKYKILLLQKYLNRWKNNAQKINDKEFNDVSAIQRAFLSYKARQKRIKLEKIKNRLTKFLIKKSNINNNKLYYYFIKWVNNARLLAIHENARIIQKFCRRIQRKLIDQKELAKNLRVKNGIEKLLSIKFGKKYAFDKINSEKKRSIFKNFNDNLQRHRLDTLKYIFDKLKQNSFDNKLTKAINVPDIFKNRLLKKAFENWRNNANKLARKKSAELLQKNIRIYLYKLKQKNQKNKLNEILKKLVNKHTNYMRNCLKKWQDITRKSKENFARNRVAQYVEERYRIVSARKNWKNLSKFLELKNRNNDIFNLVNKVKLFIKLNKFKKPFVNICRKIFIKKLISDKIKNKLTNKLIDIIPKRNDINKEILLKYYIVKWADKAKKLKDRENNLLKAMNELDKKQLLSDLTTMKNAMLMKKLFRDIPYCGVLIFLEKLKKNLAKKNKYLSLKNKLLNADNDIRNKHKKDLMDKLYKIYVYKKLDNLYNICNTHLKNKIKPTNGREFLQKLYVNRNKHLDYNYNSERNFESKSKTINFSLKNVKKTKPTMIRDKEALIKKCLPSFVKYLNNKFLHRKEDAFEKIKTYYLANKLSYILKKFKNTTLTKPKKDLIHMLQREAKYSETRPIYQIKLFKLLRKKYIREITTKLVEPSRLYNLFYLINMTQMHKHIKQQRYFRELIRKWRFICFTKKMARKKLELMYKNLHASYLQMADQIFGEDEVNPSVFKEFEMFGNNVGMFTGQEPEIEEEISRNLYSTVDKRYVFIKKNPTFDETKKVRKIKEEKITEEMEEEVITTQTPLGKDGRPVNTEMSKSSRIYK